MKQSLLTMLALVCLTNSPEQIVGPRFVLFEFPQIVPPDVKLAFACVATPSKICRVWQGVAEPVKLLSQLVHGQKRLA